MAKTLVGRYAFMHFDLSKSVLKKSMTFQVHDYNVSEAWKTKTTSHDFSWPQTSCIYIDN